MPQYCIDCTEKLALYAAAVDSKSHLPNSCPYQLRIKPEAGNSFSSLRTENCLTNLLVTSRIDNITSTQSLEQNNYTSIIRNTIIEYSPLAR